MKLTCLDECRVIHDNVEYCFEETHLFGYVYEVDDEVGDKAVATGKCRQIVEDEEHPYTGPATTSPNRRPLAPISESETVSAPSGRRRRGTEPQ